MGDIAAMVAPPGAGRYRQAKAQKRLAGATPTMNAWKHIFPVGVYISMGATCDIRDIENGGTTTVDVNQWAGWQQMLDHPDVGLLATGLTAVVTANGQVYAHETIQKIFTNTEADARYAGINVAHSVVSRIDLAGLNPDVDYWPDANTHNDTTALPFATGIDVVMGSHPSVVAYNIQDDVTATAVNRRADTAAPLIRQHQAVDDYGRPAFIVSNDDTATPVIGSDARLMYRYAHPCGYYVDDVVMAEGDFHYHNFPGTLYDEFIAWIRHFTSFDPVGLVNWWQVQCHQTLHINNGAKRYPTAREITAMSWMLVGEGAKGIFYFSWTDGAGGSENWVGLGDASSVDRLRACSTFANRLTPDIRSRLLKTTRITDAFTVSGGGSSGYRVNYANAYVSTLYDAVSATYYVVIVNHSTSTATITVSGSGALSGASGTLTNLEDGLTVALGGSVSLGPLDGSLWRFEA